jgi:predicted nucleotidyltransferase
MCQLDRLYNLRSQINEIARRHNVEKMYVFGSCARKEEKTESDIDLLADFNKSASLFDQIALQLDLADMLKCKVDIIPLSALSDPHFGPGVKKDMVAL